MRKIIGMVREVVPREETVECKESKTGAEYTQGNGFSLNEISLLIVTKRRTENNYENLSQISSDKSQSNTNFIYLAVIEFLLQRQS